MTDEEKPLSKFRDFLIPNAQNTLESASYRHFRGDFEGARKLLHLAKDGIDECLEQLQLDEQAHQNAEEADE
jgi:hypothetical protein